MFDEHLITFDFYHFEKRILTLKEKHCLYSKKTHDTKSTSKSFQKLLHFLFLYFIKFNTFQKKKISNASIHIKIHNYHLFLKELTTTQKKKKNSLN